MQSAYRRAISLAGQHRPSHLPAAHRQAGQHLARSRCRAGVLSAQVSCRFTPIHCVSAGRSCKSSQAEFQPAGSTITIIIIKYDCSRWQLHLFVAQNDKLISSSVTLHNISASAADLSSCIMTTCGVSRPKHNTHLQVRHACKPYLCLNASIAALKFRLKLGAAGV